MNQNKSLKAWQQNVNHRLRRIVLPDSPSSSSIPFFEYAKWFRFTRRIPSTPQSIDIQTKSGCNAHCGFCPVGREDNKIYGTMSDDLFYKIVDEVMTYPNLRQINPYLLNDPLVDKRLSHKLEYIARKRGQNRKPFLRITTNAGLLTEDMGYNLLQANALDEINISFHSILPEVYERMMPPLKYERVLGNIIRFKNQWDRHNGKKPKLSIWTVKTKPVLANLSNEKQYWKKMGLGFKARSLDNRANADVEKAGFADYAFEPVAFCSIPFWRVWVLWNGDMVLCCVDQERKHLMGNCSERPILDIWKDQAYRDIRLRWRTKKLTGLLCESCKGT